MKFELFPRLWHLIVGHNLFYFSLSFFKIPHICFSRNVLISIWMETAIWWLACLPLLVHLLWRNPHGARWPSFSWSHSTNIYSTWLHQVHVGETSWDVLVSIHPSICASVLFPLFCLSGFMSNSDFSTLLKDIISVNMGRNTLPEPWINMNETQVLFKVTHFTD